MPRIIEAFGGTPQIPDVTTGTPALVNAAQSVVKITGNAYACGRNQSGSGFVVGTNRVMTNAHVVAGVGEPIVQVPGGAALPGRVVYFDPVDDLAVVAVDGLTAAPLPLVPNLPAGSPAVVHGYPLGGPFNSQPASVISVHAVNVPDIYGANPTPRQVYSLATKVQQGNSGGPLLSEAGDVAGVIFAKGSDTQDVGYALAMEEVTPVAEQASSLSQPVSSGGCLAG
jgi:S1-C subfamily serine protease